MITAELAQKMTEHDYNIIEYNIDKEILTTAYQGIREYIYEDVLPFYIKKKYEENGYKITEEWVPYNVCQLRCQTHIKW